ncbi:hypothetical protein P3W85_30475 [Cupriavidus basilensis]|uniref:Uncharacterized protein n=1 Tax=Cupriavidus basilensis TaxID=68895 RepID=A0ABT6AXA5_9BURK|nr:hypothetical protein [Cupriavidus basilensis]MDF3837250.1 hypothetical protein [Cupriavidus basilensis]
MHAVRSGGSHIEGGWQPYPRRYLQSGGPEVLHEIEIKGGIAVYGRDIVLPELRIDICLLHIHGDIQAAVPQRIPV